MPNPSLSSDARVRTPPIVVVGLGGAGVNAVVRLRDVGISGVRLLAADSSFQTLARAEGLATVALGAATRGLGTGGDVRLGAASVIAAEPELRQELAQARLVFVVGGLAGGTGGGGAPEVSRIAADAGALVIGVGILPFAFESQARHDAAARARMAFADQCDTFLAPDNRRALAIAGPKTRFDVALRVADDLVRQAVQGLAELLGGQGWIRLDLAALEAVLRTSGEGCLALGLGDGPAPAEAAMRAALASPLCDMGALERAGAVLVQVTGGEELSVADTAAAIDLLRRRVPACGRLVVGAASDPTLEGLVQVTLLGTGLSAVAARAPIPFPRRPTADAEHDRALRLRFAEDPIPARRAV